MAYERYITKSGRLMITLRTYHSTVESQSEPGTMLCAPTSVEILDVDQEKVNEIKFGEFEALVSDGKLKRVTN